MSETTQNYSNHVRWHAPFHFVLLPILLLHLIWCTVRVFNSPGFESAEALLLAIGLAVMATLARNNALRAQDRVIRLEERLRFQRLLPADLAAKVSALPVGFIVALRFASDEELSELARQAVDHKFAKPRELKRAIKHWRGDYLRV
jgi:hypothetical protein